MAEYRLAHVPALLEREKQFWTGFLENAQRMKAALQEQVEQEVEMMEQIAKTRSLSLEERHRVVRVLFASASELDDDFPDELMDRINALSRLVDVSEDELMQDELYRSPNDAILMAKDALRDLDIDDPDKCKPDLPDFMRPMDAVICKYINSFVTP